MRYANEFESHNLGWSAISSLLTRYRWLILAVFLLTVATGWGVLRIFFTELYESKSTVLVKVGRETTEVPATVVNGNLLSQGVRIQDINSEVQMLSALKLIETAVDAIGAEKFKVTLKKPDSILGYPKYWAIAVGRAAKDLYKEVLYALNLKKRLQLREEVIVGIAESMKVEPIKESDVLVLKILLPSPELAQQTANLILKGYLDLRADIRRNAAARDYYDEQTRTHRDLVSALETERAKVREQWGLSSAPEQRSLLLKQLADLDTEKVDLRGQIRKLTQELQDMQVKLTGLPSRLTKEETYTRNPALQSIKERITNLEMDRARLLGRYQPQAEPIAQIDSEIGGLRKALASEDSTILAGTTSENNPLRQEFVKGIEERRIAISGLESRLQRLEEPITDIKTSLAKLNEGSDAFERVERDYRVAEQSYLAFYKRMSEAKLSEGLDHRNVANVSIISPPSLPLEPVYPRKLFIMGILLPAGLLLGAGMAALIESMNDRVRDEEDLKALPGLPYLGTVSSQIRRELEA